MFTATLPQIRQPGTIGRVFRAWFSHRQGAKDRATNATRSRREFICEMLARNPDAFQNENDMQCMMGVYPDKF